MSDIPDPAAFLAQAARCVKCALCLPHCPTYQVSQQESRSPRGRISLMQALATDALPPSPTLIGHLSSCLTCRACESVCPAEVPYYDLLLQTRTSLHAHTPISRELRIIAFLLVRPRLRAQVFRLLRLAVRWKLRPAIAGALRILRLPHLTALLPPPFPAMKKASAPPPLSFRGKVLLLSDCLQDLEDPYTLAATRYVLTQWGYAVTVQANLPCCGAWLAHQGQATQAAQTLTALTAALPDPTEYTAFLTLNSGCGAYLAQHAPQTSWPLANLYTFLWNHRPPILPLRPLPKTVGFFTPCTHRQLGQVAATTQLLSMIPALHCQILPARIGCCGAGGATSVAHPAQGAALAAPIADFVSMQHLTTVVTTNYSCALHLQTHIPNIRFCAPIHLLAQSLGFSPPDLAPIPLTKGG